MSKPAEASTETFDEIVQASGAPALVVFCAPGSAPCRLLEPILEAVGREFAGRLALVRVDIDVEPGLALRYGVFSTPTLVVLAAGNEVERLVGYRPLETLREHLAGHL